jgi:uncharacterized protein (TIRG00374 family)
LIFLASNIMGSWLWGMLLKSHGLRIPFYRVWSFYFVGLFFNNFLPANIGGDIVRIYDASKYCKDTSSVFVATFMDRVIGVLAISFLAVVASVTPYHFRIFLIYRRWLVSHAFSLQHPGQEDSFESRSSSLRPSTCNGGSRSC